jgi:hypothetical protein
MIKRLLLIVCLALYSQLGRTFHSTLPSFRHSGLNNNPIVLKAVDPNLLNDSVRALADVDPNMFAKSASDLSNIDPNTVTDTTKHIVSFPEFLVAVYVACVFWAPLLGAGIIYGIGSGIQHLFTSH